MRLVAFHIILLLMLCGLTAWSQGMSFYNDYLGNIWVFDNDNTKQIDHQPPKSYGVGNNSFVYVDNSGGLKIYHNHFLHSASSFVSNYIVTDNLISFSMNTQLKVFDDGNFSTLCASAAKYWASDDIVVWYDDMQHMLMCYWNGKKYTLDDVLSTGEPSFVSVGKNIAVYIDVNGDLNAFYIGEIEQIIYSKNLGQIALGRDIVAYVDVSTGSFHAFYKNEFVDLEDFVPKTFVCGDGFVAYVDASSYLKVFEGFKTRTISFDEPDFYEVEDGIMVFGVQNYFKAYVDGKIYTLESFIPEKYQINNRSVAYLDQMGNLKYFDGNKTETISYEKVTDFELTGDAVRYSFGVKSENIYYEGKTYKND
ncbi:MAG: hypothetical protein J6T48_12210 [Bacteroidales bacterium]|nr:hypothetical protein [Bacteroidales bacterium]